MTNDILGLIHDATELRKLIAENPDLPIVAIAGEEANGGDYCWMYCSSVSAQIEEILDARLPFDDERVFSDREMFEEAIADHLNDKETENLSEEDFDALVKTEIAKYEPYWRKVIAVYVDN